MYTLVNRFSLQERTLKYRRFAKQYILKLISDRRCFRLENGHTICPVCEVDLSPGEVTDHYAKEMDKLYAEAA